MAALASLTEIYTDSEGEEHNLSNSTPREDHSPEKPPSPVVEENNRNSIPVLNSVSNLVSYHDDTIISDDEHNVEKSSTLMELSPPTEEEEEDDIEIPTEPPGRCSNELQEKIAALYEKMIQRGGLDMNQIIQKRKDFRNPSIYEKLIQFCSINEFGTNYSPEVYDPLRWDKSSYYDELAKVQKAEMDQREKERREKTKVEFLMGTAKKPTTVNNVTADEEIMKRKSKWDQVGSGSQSVVKPPGLLPLTSSATGTKGTVISAFGSLAKKPRV
jgi:hypothetical protein